MFRVWIGIAYGLAACVNANAQSQTEPKTFRTAGWPCEYQKFVWLAPGAFWSGPDIDDSANWQEAEGVPQLANELVSRKTPLDAAEKRIAKFAKKNDSDRRQRLALLFLAVFSEINRVHAEIIQGIERAYQTRQTKIDELTRLRDEATELSAKADRTDVESLRLDKLQARILWRTRVWAQSEKSMQLICEVPLLMEQRLFDVTKLIEDQLSSNG